jgi:hypothetical protein
MRIATFRAIQLCHKIAICGWAAPAQGKKMKGINIHFSKKISSDKRCVKNLELKDKNLNYEK